MNLPYISEKLWQAVNTLATSPKTLQFRLIDALFGLVVLTKDDFPDELGREFHALIRRSTRYPAIYDEGTIVATMSRIDNGEAREIAQGIVYLAHKIEAYRKEYGDE
jgi:hypothetical protein